MPAITCSNCSTTGNVPDSFIGQRIKCRAFHQRFIVPDPPASDPIINVVIGDPEATRAARAQARVARSKRAWQYVEAFVQAIGLLSTMLVVLVIIGAILSHNADRPTHGTTTTTHNYPYSDWTPEDFRFNAAIREENRIAEERIQDTKDEPTSECNTQR